jgi:hypothetical protein
MDLTDSTRSESSRKSTARRTRVTVLEEQIAILRELNAPTEIIELAERTLRESRTNKATSDEDASR